MRFGNPSRKNGDRGFRTGQPTGVPVPVPESRPQTPAPTIPAGRFPEARVVFDPDGGHTHDGVGSALISLTGDVSGTNIATTVTKIEGKPIPAPAAGDDQKYIQFNNGTGAFQYTAPLTSGPLLDGGTRNTDTAAATPVAQDLVCANASNKWDRLAKGSNNSLLKVVGGSVQWSSAAFVELSGHLSDVATGDVTYTSNAGKVTALQNQALPAPSGTNVLLKWSGTALSWAAAAFYELAGHLSDIATGDVTYVNNAGKVTALQNQPLPAPSGTNVLLKWSGSALSWAAATFSELSGHLSDVTSGDVTYTNNAGKVTAIQNQAVGAPTGTNTLLKWSGSALSWAAAAFSELSGTLSDTQHGTRTSGGGADHTGTLSANARVAVKKGGTLVGTRRAVNVIAGSNVTLTLTDDSVNEKVDVQIDVPTGAGATTTGPLLDASRNTDTTAHTPVRGDLVVANSTPAWSPLAAGSWVGQVLKMSLTSDPTWAIPFSLLGTFVRGVINSANVGNPMPVGASTNISAGYTMPYAGYVYGLSITLDGSIGAGATYNAQLYINGSPQLLSLSLTSGTKAYKAVTAASISFNAGDTLTLVDSNSGSPGTHAAVACVFGTAA